MTRSIHGRSQVDSKKEAIIMLGNADLDHQRRRAALITVALFAALVFGLVVLAGGDWIPGGITVAAALVGLARQIPAMQRR